MNVALLPGSVTPQQRGPLAGAGIELSGAKPGSIINTASLEGLSHAVYTLTVQARLREGNDISLSELTWHVRLQGAKVYSGLYNGNIQVWHMDAYVNLPSGSRPGETHSARSLN